VIFIFRKTQVATEYVVVASLVLLIIIPLVFLYVKYTTESDYAITTAKVSSIANEISKAANSVYVYGQDSQLAIEVNFPKNLDAISFSGKDIRFIVRNNEGHLVDIVKQAEVNLFNYGELIPLTPGRKKLIVKSLGTQVLVQVPCTNNELRCTDLENFGDCDRQDGRPYCLLKCVNSVWTIEEVCSQGQCDVNSGGCIGG